MLDRKVSSLFPWFERTKLIKRKNLVCGKLPHLQTEQLNELHEVISKILCDAGILGEETVDNEDSCYSAVLKVKPWLNVKCLKLMEEKEKCLENLNVSDSRENREALQKCRSALLQELQSLRRTCLQQKLPSELYDQPLGEFMGSLLEDEGNPAIPSLASKSIDSSSSRNASTTLAECYVRSIKASSSERLSRGNPQTRPRDPSPPFSYLSRASNNSRSRRQTISRRDTSHRYSKGSLRREDSQHSLRRSANDAPWSPPSKYSRRETSPYEAPSNYDRIESPSTHYSRVVKSRELFYPSKHTHAVEIYDPYLGYSVPRIFNAFPHDSLSSMAAQQFASSNGYSRTFRG